MKWHWVLILVLVSTLLPGCGSGVATVELAVDDNFDDESESPLVDGPAADVESPEPDESEKFAPPFPMNKSFFSQPEVETAVVVPGDDTVEDDLQHANVRVIGFSQVGDNEPQALISIRGSLRSVRSGETFDGINVLALDAPNVTLQQRNERWTVALFNQPLVNKTVASRVPGRSTNHQSRWLSEDERTRGSRDYFAASQSVVAAGGAFENLDSSGTVDKNLPPAPTSLPDVTLPGAVELPDDLDLPEPPDLPSVDVSVDQRLPGIDEIPGLPSF